MSKVLQTILALGALALAGCDRPPPRPDVPTIGLSADAVSFALPADGVSFPVAQSIAIRNAGSGTMAVPMPSITLAAYQAPPGAPDGWLAAAVVAEAGGYRLVVQPTVQSGDCFLPAGDYVATVLLEVPNAVNSPRAVQVTLSVPPPVVASHPALLEFVAPLDRSDPPEQTFDLQNLGGYSDPVLEDLGEGEILSLRAQRIAGTFGRWRVAVTWRAATFAPGHFERQVAARFPEDPRAIPIQRVSLDVPPAHLRAQPEGLSFTTVYGHPYLQQTVAIQNEGRLALPGSGEVPRIDPLAPLPAWLKVIPAADFEVIVDVNAWGMAPGTYVDAVTLRMDSADNSPLVVPVTLVVVPAPPWVSTGLVTLQSSMGGQAATKVVQVNNPNPGAMEKPTVSVEYGASGSGWLSTSVTEAAAPYALEVGGSAAALGPGTYTATVTVAVGFGSASLLVVLQVPEPGPPRLSESLVSLWVKPGSDILTRTVHVASPVPASMPRPELSISYLYPGSGGWLSASIGAAQAPYALDLQIAAPGLSPGVYRSMVTVSVPGFGSAQVLVELAVSDWAPTSPMNLERHLHASAPLLDGRVLVTGGVTPIEVTESGTSFQATSRCEVYDPAAGTWAETGAMRTARESHTATRLLDGRVLVAGGVDTPDFEIFDPATGTFGGGGVLQVRQHAATLLTGGRVLLAGGGSAEIFDPAVGVITPTGVPGAVRFGAAAVPLPSGRVLVAGGATPDGIVSSAEIYDPVSGGWSAAAPMAGPRYSHALVLLQDGRALAIGGIFDSYFLWSAEVYDEAADAWSPAAHTAVQHGGRAVLLPSGKVLVTPYPSEVTELYDPATGAWTGAGPTVSRLFTVPFGGHSSSLDVLPDGRVLWVGGPAALHEVIP